MSPGFADALSTVLVNEMLSGLTTVIFVASLAVPVDGSSLTMLIPPAAVIVAWLLITVPFAAPGLIWTSNWITTLLSAPPSFVRVPTWTRRGFPSVMTSVGSSEVSEPGT